MNKRLIIIPLVFLVLATYSQDELGFEVISKESQMKLDAQSLSIGVHVGALTYKGDIQGNGPDSYFSYGEQSFGVSIEKKLGSYYGILVNGLFGKVSKEEKYENTFTNFSSTISHIDANFMLNLDNGKTLISPFVSIGLGVVLFNPKADLYSEGIEHYLWEDGTFRDLDQNSLDAENSTIVFRDYKYETELEGRDMSYSTTSLTLPVWAGLKLKLSRKIDAKIAAAYIHTFTDNIDNINAGGNDKLFYGAFGISYNLVKTNRSDKYRDIDFTSLFNEDSDKDGVKDNVDFCPGTPDSVKVDQKGCALDADKDGVPDYVDKESNTPKNTSVDKQGVTIVKKEVKTNNNVEVVRKKFNSNKD
jgi:hypothetical protein